MSAALKPIERADREQRDNRRADAIAQWNASIPLAQGEDNAQKGLAYRMWLSCVDIDPDFAPAWYMLGNANNDAGLKDAAIACWRRVVEIEPGHGRAWTNMGHQLFHSGRVKEALKVTQRAIETDPTPEYPVANMAMIESVLGNNAKSLRYAQQAAEMSRIRRASEGVSGIDPIVELQLAFSHFYAGNWIAGLQAFESRFPYKLAEYLDYPYARWDGAENSDPVSGTILYVPAEQGMGDAISFIRFIPEAARRVGALQLVVHPELVRLFRAMLQDSPNVSVQPLPGTFPEADAWCPMTSLPLALGLTDEQFEAAPGLPMPGFQLPTSWKAKGRGGREPLHVGIAWAGNPSNDIDRWRSMSLEPFLELARVPGVQLYALQFGPHQQDLWAIGAGALVRDLQPQVRDVADTVAIVKELDLVITIESALGHIAGAVGKECWIAYSMNGGDYRIGRNRQKPIWYPNHRIFKQGDDATWPPVFERIVAAVRERVKAGGS